MAGIAEHRRAGVFGKRGLQTAVAVLACIPVLAGAMGVIEGPAFLKATLPWPADLDSHVRFLSGLFLAVGLAWWATIPSIERKGERFRLLALLIVAAGWRDWSRSSTPAFPRPATSPASEWNWSWCRSSSGGRRR